MDILSMKSVFLKDSGDALVILDQTKLPGKMEIVELTTQKEIWEAIYLLKVRGAPAIGVAAAIGLYLAAREIKAETHEEFYSQLSVKKEYLASARPTAVNLFWALDRMEKCAKANGGQPINVIVEKLREEALKISDENIEVCRSIGEHGLPLIKEGMGILTHCNAGAIATVRYGTALAPIYVAKEEGIKNIKVFCDETRPLLQGARLTAFELQSAGIDTCLICDSSSSMVMEKGWVQIVLVGCDRVARNGDTANKIGTNNVAILAAHYHIPFYVCAPTSTIDLSIASGADIHIEERPASEVTEMWYKERMAPKDIAVFNPAFDVTDHSLITGIITEYGIAYPPFEKSFKELGIIK